jgi:hypothetical protein
MRVVLVLGILLCLQVPCWAQNYQCVQPGLKRYFTSQGGLLKGIRIDSTNTVNGNLVLYPFRTPRGGGYLNQPYIQLDTNGGSWIGKTITIQTDGTTYFDTRFGDTVVIRTQAHPGESWIFHNDTSSRSYIATVTAVDTLTVLNILDSIKTILLTAYNGSSVDPADLAHHKSIVLSKAHGLFRTISLHTFPYRAAGSPYLPDADYFMDMYDVINHQVQSYELTAFRNPDSVDVFNYGAGDIFEYFKEDTSPPLPSKSWTLDSIISRTVGGSSVDYLVRRAERWHFPGAPSPDYYSDTTFHLTIGSGIQNIVDTSLMPEETGNILAHYYQPTDTSQCSATASYKRLQLNLTDHGQVLMPHCTIYEVFKHSLGRTAFYQECSGGTDHFITLVYSKKDGQPCGNFIPLSIDDGRSPENELKVYPVPATEVLNISYGKDFAYVLAATDGRVISRGTGGGTTSFSVRAVPPGLYYLVVRDSKGANSTVKKIIIKQ